MTHPHSHEIKVRDGRLIALNVLKYAILIVGAFIMIFPFLWMLLTSLKSLDEAIRIPPMWLPGAFRIENYTHVWEMAPFMRYIFNTTVCCILHVAGVVVFSVMGAYAFSMYEFKGKKVLFMLFLATMMVPGELLIIQNYITINKLQLMDTFAAVVLPTFASGFYTYMLREHFLQIPPALYKSAKVDGTSNWRFLWRVMVPMNKNTVATIAILSFIAQWNAFMWPNIVTQTDKTRLVSSGLFVFRSEASSNLQYMMAGSCIIIFPMVIFYIIFRKRIINGVGGGGIKG